MKRRARSFVRARARAARNSSERVLRRPDTRGAVRERRGRARSVLVMTRAVDGFATRPDFVDEARVIFLAPRQHREHFFARLLGDRRSATQGDSPNPASC